MATDRDVVRDDVWEDLVVAVLSVNQYSLERTYSALEGLRTSGLFEPANLMKWDVDEFGRRLRAAGCDRGEFMTNLFAVRLASLGHFLSQTGVEQVKRVLRSKNHQLIEQTLLPVKGTGPKVIKNYCFLQGIAGL
jgi:hypothetical protein